MLHLDSIYKTYKGLYGKATVLYIFRSSDGSNAILTCGLHFFCFRRRDCVKANIYVYFIMLCQILAMKLNVCMEITSTDLNDKNIPSLESNVSPGRYS